MRNYHYFLFIISILITNCIYSQSDIINKYDEKGRKIGYWITYHDNGNIKTEGTYKVGKTSHSQETLFMKGYTADISGVLSFKDGLWKEYDENGQLISEKVYRNLDIFYQKKYVNDSVFSEKINYHDKDKYIVNNKIYVKNSSFYYEGKAGETNEFTVDIYSFSNEKLYYRGDLTNNLKIECNYIIQPHSWDKIKLSKKIKSGYSNDTVHMYFNDKDNIILSFTLKSFGYNLTEDDMDIYKDKLSTYITNENIF